jgi:valyl-tRNA synthetase
VVTPLPLLETHGSDGVRYWAASGRPGTDTAVDEGQMKVGRRLAMKILNASRFALSRIAGGDLPGPEAVTAPIDLAMLGDLARVVDEGTAAFEGYDYARALERTEAFFWSFCDDYLELVKGRAYQDPAEAGPASARAALGLALSVLLRLLAPFVPFVTEEVWSWWHEGSVHRSPWPVSDEFPSGGRVAGDESTGAGESANESGREIGSESGSESGSGADSVLSVVSEILGVVRRNKTTAKRSMRAPVARLEVVDTAERLALMMEAENDLRDAGGIVDLVTSVGPADVRVVLAEEEPG